MDYDIFESLSFEKQEQSIANLKNNDFLDFEFDDKFNKNFGKDGEKKEDNINQNYLVFDHILENNTLKPHHLFFKYRKTSRLA